MVSSSPPLVHFQKHQEFHSQADVDVVEVSVVDVVQSHYVHALLFMQNEALRNVRYH